MSVHVTARVEFSYLDDVNLNSNVDVAPLVIETSAIEPFGSLSSIIASSKNRI